MTIEEHRSEITETAQKYPEEVAKAMNRVAVSMVADSRLKHLSGPKMPRGVSGGFDGSTLASKTGMIFRIHHIVNIESDRVVGKVGMNLTSGGGFFRRGYNYPRAHEYGLYGMPERPWLRPAIYGRQNELYEEIEKEVLASHG